MRKEVKEMALGKSDKLDALVKTKYKRRPDFRIP